MKVCMLSSLSRPMTFASWSRKRAAPVIPIVPFFREVEKPPPGHRMLVDVSTGQIEIRHYYSLAPSDAGADEANAAHLPRNPLRRFARKTKDAREMQVLEITETNLPMLLRFEDKNSMRFGIEKRVPFLDYLC